MIFVQKEFRWSQWQERIDVLRVWLSTLKREQQEAKRSLSSEKKEGPLAVSGGGSQLALTLLQHLTVQAETVEALLQSLANTEALVGKMEEAVAAARTKGTK